MAIPRKKLILALDTSDSPFIKHLIKILAVKVGMFKVGSQAFTAFGPSLISEIQDAGGNVFLDLKYHDIPNTVGSAVEEAARLGVSLLTVHAAGGRKMLEETAKRLKHAPGPVPGRQTQAVAVTVLTSLDKNDFSELGISRSMEDQVLQMANLAKECGLSGVVASPMEVEWLRKNLGPDFTIVVPGIRPAEAGLDDQKRIATPAEAITRGASYIVVGRPILKANDPVQAIEEILGS